MDDKKKKREEIPEETENRQPTAEEQMMRRQSAPTPTARDEAIRMLRQRQGGMSLRSQGIDTDGAVNGYAALDQPIGKEAVSKATQILNKYKEGKANLEKRIIADEQWYKLRHWSELRKPGADAVEPTSAWLFNCICKKHSDAMDNFPSPNILPREEGDKAEAEMLSSIIPVILDQNDFEQTYDEVSLQKLKCGTGVYGVFWDNSKLNGLGDISIVRIDPISLYWEPGVRDIQMSQNLFHVELRDNDVLMSQYPQTRGKLGNATIRVSEYQYDDTVDTTNKSAVIDWYYKKPNSEGKIVVHYCKYVNDIVLTATENDPGMKERGIYDHGKYPFEFDILFPEEGTPAGFGYIDIGKSAQEYIDRGNQAIMKNMLVNAKPRYLSRQGDGINEEEFADMNNDIVHYNGAVDSIIPITSGGLGSIYLDVLTAKIDELKETTGNRDISNGGTTGGVTAASSIAALQEAASSLSRDANRASFRVFRKLCLTVIELIRQFYDLPRCFRILGENGTARFVQYSNAGLQPQAQGMEFGVDMGMRLPLFDVDVSAQKQSPYSKMSQNELALQFYQLGFFNPTMADQALACLDMMDFDRKDFIAQKISQNGGMIQQMMMLAQMVDGGAGEVSAGLAQQFGIPIPRAADGAVEPENNKALGGTEGVGEPNITKKARQRVAESTSPT